MKYHNISYHGLGRDDQLLFGKKRKNWKEPSESNVCANRSNVLKHEKEYLKKKYSVVSISS